MGQRKTKQICTWGDIENRSKHNKQHLECFKAFAPLSLIQLSLPIALIGINELRKVRIK